MDYSKSVIPSHLLGDRNSNLVVINPGSANVRIGLAHQDAPFSIPHCIARRTTGANQSSRRNVQDQMLNSQVTTVQHAQREKVYDIIASLLKIPFLDEEVANNSYPRKVAKKFCTPYVDQIALTTKHHLDRARETMKPYTNEALHAYAKFLESATIYHNQVQLMDQGLFIDADMIRFVSYSIFFIVTIWMLIEEMWNKKKTQGDGV